MSTVEELQRLADGAQDEPLDPEQITRELRQASRALAASAAKLGKLTREYNGTGTTGSFEPGAGRRFEALVKVRAAAIYNQEDRPPPEAVRETMAEQEIRAADPPLAANYDRISTEMFALKQFISTQRQVISGHQSVLSASKVLSGLSA